MRAIVVEEPGGTEVLALKEVPTPEPKDAVMHHQKAEKIGQKIPYEEQVEKHPPMNHHKQIEAFSNNPGEPERKRKIDDQVVPPRQRGKDEPDHTNNTPRQGGG